MAQLISIVYSAIGLLGLVISIGIDSVLFSELFHKKQDQINFELGIRVTALFFISLFILKVLA